MNTKTICSLALVGFAALCAILPTAAAQSSVKADAQAVAITGQLNCSRFVGQVTARKGMSVAQTIQYCVNQGNDYTVVAGNKIYRVSGDRKVLARLAGQTVTVVGHLEPLPQTDTGAYVFVLGTLHADNVAPAEN